jgi:hypothetical protein
MKKFNKIADNIFRTLLEAPLPPGGNNVPDMSPGLPQDGGPVAAPAVAATPADRSPAELQNWETQLITIAADAIVRVKTNPSILDIDDIKILSSGVNLTNKDEVLDIIKTLGGKI